MLSQYLSTKRCKYANTGLEFFSDALFLAALEAAPNDTVKANVIDNWLQHLRENFVKAEQAIAHLQGMRSALQPQSQQAKKIIVNCNGTACPPFAKSVHEEYLMAHLGEPDTVVCNVAGVGIAAKDSSFNNLMDLSYAHSLPLRVQSVLDFIRDNAAEDCVIDITGHSRGGVEAIILGRIVSQKYPGVRVIAHDPVPANRTLPLSQSSYYNKTLDVSAFLPKSQVTIKEVLTDEALPIRGALMVPWRRDDNRPHFALLDGECVYAADAFYPVELSGFHNMGIYEYTPVDYAVFAKGRLFIDGSLRNRSKKAGQGGFKDVDSERGHIKSLLCEQYRTLVSLFTDSSEVLEDEASFHQALKQYHTTAIAELSAEGLSQSEATSNPAYHFAQKSGRRKLPKALDVFEDTGFDEDMYDYVRRHSHEGEFSGYTGVKCQALLEKLTHTPSEVKATDLLYLSWYWVAATLASDQGTLVDNLRHSLFSNSHFAKPVQFIAHCAGLEKVMLLLRDSPGLPRKQVVQVIRQSLEAMPKGITQQLGLQVLDSSDDLEPLFLQHQQAEGSLELLSLMRSRLLQDRLMHTLLPAAVGLVLGVVLGVVLVATGILAPFGVGIWGLVGMAALSGAGLSLLSGGVALGLDAAEYDERCASVGTPSPQPSP